MIKKVFIGESSDAKYLVSEEFSTIKYVECTDLSFKDFIRLHQPSLFDSSLICFLNVDKLETDEELLELCSNVKTEVIWCFESLRKNSKLFKKLSSCSNVSVCEQLTKTQSKKDFIKTLLLKNSLPLKFQEIFVIDGPEDRLILKSEIEKFACLHAITRDEEVLKKAVCKFNGSLDTLEFVSHLLNRNIKLAYVYAIKVSNEAPAMVIAATILKKLKAMMYLSLGDVNSANLIWRHGNYYLDQAIKQAKGIGFTGLLNLYEYVDTEFSNPINNKDLMTRLSGLILHIDRRLYDKTLTNPVVKH
jgi:hypothetical protein